MRRADGVGREVGVGEDDLVAVAHLGQDFEEIGGDDGGDAFQDHLYGCDVFRLEVSESWKEIDE